MNYIVAHTMLGRCLKLSWLPAAIGVLASAACSDTSETVAPTVDAATTADAALDDSGVGCRQRASLLEGGAHAMWMDALGSPWDAYHPEPPTSDSAPEGPEYGRFCHLTCEFDAVDWAGYGGQVVSLAEPGLGVDRARFLWSLHEGHGGAEYAHDYRLAPVAEEVDWDSDTWFVRAPDPVLAQEDYVAANGGPLGTPTALGRGLVNMGNNAVLAFESGIIATSGPGNSGDKYPMARLADRLVPTAVAVTLNSELALVAAWDTEDCTGALVVIALKDRGVSWMMPSRGHFTGLKILGVVALEGMSAPTSIATSQDVAQYDWFSEAELDQDDTRQLWLDGTDGRALATKGYAIVASRDENLVGFVDLSPTLQWIHDNYLGDTATFQATLDAGPGAEQWPYALADDELPRWVGSVAVERPGPVVAGYDVGDRDFDAKDFGLRAYVATESELVAFDTTPLVMAGESPRIPDELARRALCNNATHIAYGRGHSRRDQMLVTCRGDRQILVLDGDGNTVHTLSDERLDDPVTAIMTGSRGASVITVGDHADGEVHNYLYGSISSWGDTLFGEKEEGSLTHLGSLSAAGPVVRLSAAEID